MRRRVFLGLAAAAAAGAGRAQPAPFPQPGRPVRLVLPYPPGGGGDALARHLAQHLALRLGVPVFVDNRPGATTVIGATEVARAAPDGHTLLLNTVGFLVHLPAQAAKLPYDPWVSFTPITPLMDVGLILVAHPSVPARDVAGLVRHASAHPGELAYASWGAGGASHFYFVLLERQTGIRLHHVPYKGLAEIQRDLLANRVQLVFEATRQGQQYVREGRLRALAATGERRVNGMEDVPTFQEQGFPGFEWARGMGLFGPGGLPAEIARRLHAEVVAIVQAPETRSFMAGFGFEPTTLAPHLYAEQLKGDARTWWPLLKKLNLTVDL